MSGYSLSIIRRKRKRDITCKNINIPTSRCYPDTRGLRQTIGRGTIFLSCISLKPPAKRSDIMIKIQSLLPVTLAVIAAIASPSLAPRITAQNKSLVRSPSKQELNQALIAAIEEGSERH